MHPLLTRINDNHFQHSRASPIGRRSCGATIRGEKGMSEIYKIKYTKDPSHTEQGSFYLYFDIKN